MLCNLYLCTRICFDIAERPCGSNNDDRPSSLVLTVEEDFDDVGGILMVKYYSTNDAVLLAGPSLLHCD